MIPHEPKTHSCCLKCLIMKLFSSPSLVLNVSSSYTLWKSPKYTLTWLCSDGIFHSQAPMQTEGKHPTCDAQHTVLLTDFPRFLFEHQIANIISQLQSPEQYEMMAVVRDCTVCAVSDITCFISNSNWKWEVWGKKALQMYKNWHSCL